MSLKFTDEQRALIRKTCVPDGGIDDANFAAFIHTCERTGLDPIAKQIYLRKGESRGKTTWTAQTGIDGYRLIADRTGQYAGNDDPIYDDETAPRKATVTVYKMLGGVRCPFTSSARWEQYCPKGSQDFMWRRMPHLMLGKCAEALALRKAFPAELSGVYVKEEMDQAEHRDGEDTSPDDAQRRLLNPPPLPAAKRTASAVDKVEQEIAARVKSELDPKTPYSGMPMQKKELLRLFRKHGISDRDDMVSLAADAVAGAITMGELDGWLQALVNPEPGVKDEEVADAVPGTDAPRG